MLFLATFIFFGATTLVIWYFHPSDLISYLIHPFHLINIRFPSKLSTEHVTIPVHGLPQHLVGVKVAQLSDIHYQENLDETYLSMLREAVTVANSYDPHLTVVTGDLVDFHYNPSILDGVSSLLSNLQARYGRYVILGNHDYYKGGKLQAEKIKSALEAKGLKVLINASVYPFHQSMELKSNEKVTNSSGVGNLSHQRENETADFALVGLGDILGGEFRPETVFPFIPPDTPRLVLSHNPDTATELRWWRADVILSGHTHAGQICLPSFQSNRGYPVLPILKFIYDHTPSWLGRWVPGRGHFYAVNNWQWAQGLHKIPRAKEDIKNGPLLRDSLREHDADYNMLYVNRGLYSIYKRFLCAPEVTIITLTAA